jgi:VWFA-related protein
MPYAKDMDYTTRVLNNANVAVYPIDSRFLAVNDDTVSDKSMMEDIAKATGGVAFTSRRDVGNAVRDAISDTRVVYVARYAISDLKPDGKFHAIKVDTSRKDVKMRYRGGYYAPMSR